MCLINYQSPFYRILVSRISISEERFIIVIFTLYTSGLLKVILELNDRSVVALFLYALYTDSALIWALTMIIRQFKTSWIFGQIDLFSPFGK